MSRYCARPLNEEREELVLHGHDERRAWFRRRHRNDRPGLFVAVGQVAPMSQARSPI
ncbi:MAG: hypothetical protein ACYCVM_07790 [Acidiferrobacter sp.]